MATQSATFTFSLPEDLDADTLCIEEATTQTGTYTEVATPEYSYGELSYEYDSLDDTKWYRIRFLNSTDSEYGPYSESVYGGDFDNASPFLAVSTATDGAHYASTQDVYNYSNLTATDATRSQVSAALKRARAVIDLRTAELSLSRFKLYPTEIARKKYNATMRILKEAEINIALGHLYRNLADDLIMAAQRDATEVEPTVSIGSTSLGSTGQQRLENVPKLIQLSDRYLGVGAAMLEQIQPSSVRFTSYDPECNYSPKFLYPWV
jgi:hypothetical protein